MVLLFCYGYAMECIVFSDTHGNYPLAIEILSRSTPVDTVFHLGDKAEDAIFIEHLFKTKVQKVAGNCDPPGMHEREIITMYGNKRILLTHGDRYGVKAGLEKLVERGVDANVDLVLYGHTHHASIDEIEGILFVNPGSLQLGTAYKSYARITIDDQGIEARIMYLDE